MRHVLVTGGAGFIGSQCVRELVERGLRVRVLDALRPPVHAAGRVPELPTDVDVPLPYAANLEKMALIKAADVVEAVKAVTYR